MKKPLKKVIRSPKTNGGKAKIATNLKKNQIVKKNKKKLRKNTKLKNFFQIKNSKLKLTN